MASPAALVVLLKERLNTLVEAMPAAQSGDMRSVHQARVATRRLREALPVLHATIAGRGRIERARRRVRKMTQALGPVRELDVALEHLDEFAARNVVSTRALSRVRQGLARERAGHRRALLAAITPGKIEKLRQQLTDLSDTPDESAPQAAVEAARKRLATRAARLAAAIDRAGGLYLPDRLHQVRIAAKKLRYALEIERELTRSRGTARITQLKRLQDLLGRMHDYEILIDRTRQVQTEVAERDRRLSGELDALVRNLEAECRRDHAVYMRRRRGILALCEALTPPDAQSAVA